jgi:hypothetical protein
MDQYMSDLQALESDKDCVALFTTISGGDGGPFGPSTGNVTLTSANAAIAPICENPCMDRMVDLMTKIINCEAGSGSSDQDITTLIIGAFGVICTQKPGAVDGNGKQLYCGAYFPMMQDNGGDDMNNTKGMCEGLSAMGCCTGTLWAFAATISGAGSGEMNARGDMIKQECDLAVFPPPACPKKGESIDLVEVSVVIDGVKYSWFSASAENEAQGTLAIVTDLAAAFGVDPGQISIVKISQTGSSSSGMHLLADSITVDAIVIPVGSTSAADVKAAADAAISKGITLTAVSALPAEALSGTPSVNKDSSSTEQKNSDDTGSGSGAAVISFSLSALLALAALYVF